MDSAASEPFDAGTEATLVGGEPLLDARALEWISVLRERGADKIGVWTDGRVLASKGAAEKLRDAGLTDVGVVLLGADAAAHDFVAGGPKRFAAALRGLRWARRAGLRTTVVAPVLRPTFRDLPLLVQRALAIGVERFDFVGLAGPDRREHGLIPHLAIAAAHVDAAIRTARRHRRQARAWQLPPCLLAPDVRDAAREIGNAFGQQDMVVGENPAGLRHSHIAACTGCELRSSCDGPLESYVAQHGSGGLVAVIAAIPSAAV